MINQNKTRTTIIQKLLAENNEQASRNLCLRNLNEELQLSIQELRSNFDRYIITTNLELGSLKAVNEEYKLRINELTDMVTLRDAEIVELKRKINMDSSNSSFPPSLDIKKNKSQPENLLDEQEQENEETPAAIQRFAPQNLLEKCQLWVHDAQQPISSLTNKDQTILKLLLSSIEFQQNGAYSCLRPTLEKLANKDFANCTMSEIISLLENKYFIEAANYRNRGGQTGHKGHCLKQVADPDQVVAIQPDICSCGCMDLNVLDEYEARQEIGISISKIITEYRLLKAKCNKCGTIIKAQSSLPRNVFYNTNIRGYAVYMLDAHYMSYERLVQFFNDILGLQISEGSINNWRKEFASKLGEGYLAELKLILQRASYLHADETGHSVDGFKVWAHVICNESGTILQASQYRGIKGITASGVLDKYTGTLVVDGWSAYKSLPSISGIQTFFAHLFRYFKDLSENYQQAWALTMLNFLHQFIEQTASLNAAGVKAYSEENKANIIKEYDSILLAGKDELEI